MFSTSTQRRFWIFDSPDRIKELRQKSNKSASKSILKEGKVDSDSLLSPRDELYLIRTYLVTLREFCRLFTPPMPDSVIATAFMYMKRFYLMESCMDYHPRNIGITCAYLACKVDEFNVSIDVFIKNVNGDCKKAQKTILSNELLLMKKLNFNLTVHLPLRAVKGFLIDIRARYPTYNNSMAGLVSEIDDYLEKAMYTDACFLYTPSQIALSAICYAAERNSIDLSPYVRGILYANDPEAYEYFLEVAKGIRKLIENHLQDSPNKDLIKKVEKRLNEIAKSSKQSQ